MLTLSSFLSLSLSLGLSPPPPPSSAPRLHPIDQDGAPISDRGWPIKSAWASKGVAACFRKPSHLELTGATGAAGGAGGLLVVAVAFAACRHSAHPAFLLVGWASSDSRPAAGSLAAAMRQTRLRLSCCDYLGMYLEVVCQLPRDDFASW